MHVLCVIDHPNPASFSHAVGARFMAGAQAAGHTVELADLNAEGFDPRWTMADVAVDGTGPMPADVIAQQARIDRADAIAMIFPLFWWGMPATMKGWVDRVWCYGWAYKDLAHIEDSLQRPRTGVMLIPSAASSDNMADKGYADALQTCWHQGTMGYFGFRPRAIHLLNGSEGSQARRLGLLDRAEEIGRTLPAPASA